MFRCTLRALGRICLYINKVNTLTIYGKYLKYLYPGVLLQLTKMTNTDKDYLNDLKTRDSKILSAFKFAFSKHKGQVRKSGEPYIEHCIGVYKILESWGVENQELLIAALLHDVVEDTDTETTQISKKFGRDVALLVESVTQLKIGEEKDKDINTLKKIINGLYIDPRVSLLKLADRYHNLCTLQYMPTEKRERKAKESVEVYAELAESLGLWIVKNEIENLSFKYLNFDKFSKIKTAVDHDARIMEVEISKTIKQLNKILSDYGVNCRIETRQSGYYHVYQKLKFYSIKGVSFNEDYRKINDIISYRVIVSSLDDCYKALCAIHKYYGNLVDYDRFDEFIGTNKRINGYEAIQTTINTEHGAIEIAVATEDMENFNNWGYVFCLKNDIKSPIFNLKLVFTPDGDLVFLQEKARAIDFAYSINRKLGDNALKALVNDSTVDLDYVVHNTDTVKIITGVRSLEDDNYLLSVCLPGTKRLIQNKIIEEEKLESIKQGKEILEDHLAPRGIIDLTDIEGSTKDMVFALGCENIDEIYYRISKGYLNVDKLDSLLNEYGITKNKLNWCTLRIQGNDSPGILNVITEYISRNKGNIVRIAYTKGNSGEEIYLRVVFENLDLDGSLKLKTILQKKFKLRKVEIV